MFAVIFIVEPKPGRFEEYLALAKSLKPEIESIDGFIDNERFRSTRRVGQVLSLSTWRDEKALVRWRTRSIHHTAQEKGRCEILDDYHLRVGEVTADTAVPSDRQPAQQRFDETEVGAAKLVTISELSTTKGDKPFSDTIAADLGLPRSGTHGIVDREAFESIYNPGKLLFLVSWRNGVAAEAWRPKRAAAGTLRDRQVRIIRDYGMRDRREAPQYYPPVRAPREDP